MSVGSLRGTQRATYRNESRECPRTRTFSRLWCRQRKAVAIAQNASVETDPGKELYQYPWFIHSHHSSPEQVEKPNVALGLQQRHVLGLWAPEIIQEPRFFIVNGLFGTPCTD